MPLNRWTLIAAVASYPFITGIWISMKITSYVPGAEATNIRYPSPPFVAIVSHFDDTEHREHALRAGSDAFVSKLNYMQEVLPLLERLAGNEAGA